MRSLACLMLVSLVSGCRPGLDFEIGDGGPVPDAPGADGALDGSRDSGGRDARLEDDPCAPEVMCADCPMPWLLAAVEDLPSGVDCGDRVYRWSVPSTGPLCACGSYAPGGGQIRTVGFVPPNSVVVAGPGSVLALAADTGASLWSAPLDGEPVDVFAIDAPNRRVGIATRNLGISGIREARLYDPASSETPDVYRTNDGAFPLGTSILSMTQSSSSTRLRALKQNGDWAAVDVDPVASVRYDTPAHTPSRSGFDLASVHTYSYDGIHRTVWTGKRSDLSGAPSRVFRVTNTTPMDDNFLSNEQWCDQRGDGSDYDVECTFEHAVSDPADATRVLAICTHSGGRRLVRVSADNTCTDLFADADVFPSGRLVRLSVAAATLWP